MKKIFLAFLVLFSVAYTAKAQTPPLNKQETLDYISKIYKSTHLRPTQPQWKVEKVHVDAKVLIITYIDGTLERKDFLNLKNLIVAKSEETSLEPGNGLYYIVEDGKDIKSNIFMCIQLESDANRLKKALEHLIELVKAEKSTDPFDN